MSEPTKPEEPIPADHEQEGEMAGTEEVSDKPSLRRKIYTS